jgi:hypothetical protein
VIKPQEKRGQEMKKNVMLLRISYWVAAIADFVVAVIVLFPSRMGVTAFVYPMGLMAAVAFSWGVLLIMADRKPMERRWVLLPTILVVFLLGLAGIFAALRNLISTSRIIWTSVAVYLILSLLIYSYIKTRKE